MGVTVVSQAEKCGRKNMKVIVEGGHIVVRERKNEFGVVMEGSVIMKNSMKLSVPNVSHINQNLNRK